MWVCSELTDFQQQRAALDSAVRTGNTDPLLQLNAAQAESDLIGYSVMHNDSGERAELRKEVPAARRRAMELYRGILARVRDRDIRRKAWIGAMMVMLDIPTGGACPMLD
jgi:hypothetical protein